MNLANKLTIFRMILVPIFVIVGYLGTLGIISGEFLEIPLFLWIMNIVFIIASITDKLDGYIARSRNQVTTFGKFLDPLADKILMFVDKYNFFDFVRSTTNEVQALSSSFQIYMSQGDIILNIITSIIMLISVIATIVSGYDYLKNGKDLFKE